MTPALAPQYGMGGIYAAHAMPHPAVAGGTVFYVHHHPHPHYQHAGPSAYPYYAQPMVVPATAVYPPSSAAAQGADYGAYPPAPASNGTPQPYRNSAAGGVSPAPEATVPPQPARTPSEMSAGHR